MIDVAVVDDHAVVRAGIVQIISECVGMRVVGEASSVDELIELAWSKTFDVLVLDVSLDERMSLDGMKTVLALKSKLPVIVLSMYSETQYATRYLRAGAAGYLTKSAAPEELVAAIDKVASGGRYITPSVAELALLESASQSFAPHRQLSDREYEVMVGIARGRRVQEIAIESGLSQKTVSTYRTRIMRKLNCRNNAGIVKYALDHDLLE